LELKKLRFGAVLLELYVEIEGVGEGDEELEEDERG